MKKKSKNLSLKDRIAAEEQDEEIKEFCDYCLELVKHSRSKMKEHYTRWDRNRETYKGERPADLEDLEARELGEPEKIIAPMGFAQTNTFIAFAFLLYTQNQRFFELRPRGNEDYRIKEDSEEYLERDLRRNNWPTKLYQLLLDACLTGICVTKEWWSTDKRLVLPPLLQSSGISADVEGLAEEVIVDQGNLITNISPYNFFPDCRVPLSDWSRGQFAADESEVSKRELEEEERQGLISGLKYIEAMSAEKLKERGGTRLADFRAQVTKRKKTRRSGNQLLSDTNDNSLVLRLEMQIEVVPKDHGLGHEEYPVRYLVQILNDSRIVRLERMGYLHMQMGYNVGQISPDQHELIGRSISDASFNLQDIMTFLFNSRVHAIRKSIDGKVIADPDFFDENSFADPLSPVVWLRKGAPKVGANQIFGQLKYDDNTSDNFNDMEFINRLQQQVTGVNENAMGQINTGRRSAEEARAANAGGASRMKLSAVLIWNAMIAPMGKKMLINARQGIEFDTFQKIFGTSEDVPIRFEAFKPADWKQLIANEDFFFMDGTLPSEKFLTAQALQELVQVLIANPMNAQMLDLNPSAMIQEIMELRGAGRKNRFSLTQNPETNGQLPGQNALGTNPLQPAAPGIPGESAVQKIPE